MYIGQLHVTGLGGGTVPLKHISPAACWRKTHVDRWIREGGDGTSDRGGRTRAGARNADEIECLVGAVKNGDGVPGGGRSRGDRGGSRAGEARGHGGRRRESRQSNSGNGGVAGICYVSV